jgi:hypothetical protein
MTALLNIGLFLLKHWKTVAAIGLLLGVFYQGYHLANKTHELRAARAEAQTLKARLATVTLTQALDAKRATADRLTLNTLERIANETPPNSGACLDRAATRRVQSVK